jgi:hypothetical protein
MTQDTLLAIYLTSCASMIAGGALSALCLAALLWRYLTSRPPSPPPCPPRTQAVRISKRSRDRDFARCVQLLNRHGYDHVHPQDR